MKTLLIALAILFLSGCWNWTGAQTFSAGTFSLSVPYTAVQDEIMQAEFGSDWPLVMRGQCLELLKNRRNQARDEFRASHTDAVTLEDEDASDLFFPAELLQIKNATRILKAAADTAAARKARAAAAAANEIGALNQQPENMNRIEKGGYVGYVVNAGYGKSVLQPFNFFDGWETTNTNGPTFSGIVGPLIIPAVIVGAIIFIITMALR